MRADRVPGGYVLNGAEQFITFSIAALIVVYAVTDPAAGKRGISAFLVTTDRPGSGVNRVELKLGQAASDTCAIRFDNLFVEVILRELRRQNG